MKKVKDQLFFHLTLREVFFDEKGDFRDDVLRKSVGVISDEEYEQIKSDMINNSDDENVSSFLNASIPAFLWYCNQRAFRS